MVRVKTQKIILFFGLLNRIFLNEIICTLGICIFFINLNIKKMHNIALLLFFFTN